MSVGSNADKLLLDPAHVLIKYVLLMLAALATGLLFGFAVVPGVPRPGLADRLARAVEATAELLAAAACVVHGEKTAPERTPRELTAAARSRQGPAAAHT
ncbi:hypothetical protein ACFU8W_02785 [Streptomyces sp. NPDC057565]|uniref:hypothetical protein n=1 Tax=Streptomyces sp. NPDC057565 TaxID=3346169 RepID=UPI0036A04140